MVNLIAALETAETNAFADLYAATPAGVATDLGLSITTIGDASIMAVNAIDVLALNRVVGLGIEGEPSDEHLSRVLDAIGRTGSPRLFVQVAPLNGYDSVGTRLEARGLRHYNNWMRLRRDLTNLEALPPPSADQRAARTPIEVHQIDADQAGIFGRIVAGAFGYPPPLVPLSGQVVGRPHWHHYLAYDGETPIAAAAMYVNDQAAWFGFAGTDAAHRGRGGQHALVTRRLKDAAEAGCRWVSVETAEDTITRDAPSFRNLRRFGFEVAYKRPNYLWTKRA